jgi:acyl-CoA thioesterase I
VAVSLLLIGVVSCTGSKQIREHDSLSRVHDSSRSLVYVAIGASDTAGIGTTDPLRDAWPNVLWRKLPPGTSLYNLGVPGSTTREAIIEQLPLAMAADPDIVTVWLNANDILRDIRPAQYGRNLQRLLASLGERDSVIMLVANVPKLYRLPLYRACRSPDGRFRPPFGPTVNCPQDVLGELPAPARARHLVNAYNAQIEQTAMAAGARLVDLHGLVDSSVERRAYVSSDGFHPSTSGAVAIAMAFWRAYKLSA